MLRSDLKEQSTEHELLDKLRRTVKVSIQSLRE